jgi:hypothetical protein
MTIAYRVRLFIVGENDARPFKSSDLQAKNDAEAWEKALTWFEEFRPWNYNLRELILMRGDTEVRKETFSVFPRALCLVG